MGLDFIRKNAKTFTKAWDNRRVELGTPDLFTLQPRAAPRTAAASIGKHVTLTEGEVLTIQQSNGDLVAMRGLSEVARFNDPPSELVRAVREGCNVARGTVQQVHRISQTAEISIA